MRGHWTYSHLSRTAKRLRYRRSHECRLQLERLERRSLLAVTSIFPIANALDAEIATDIHVDFDQPIDDGTVSDQTVAVHAGYTGRLISADGDITDLSASGMQITLNPAAAFHPGEMVRVTVTDGVETTGGSPAGGPFVWQFQTAPSGGSGRFADSGQSLAANETFDIQLGDVDADGDLDAVAANYYDGTWVWLNDGAGNFSDSGQRLEAGYSRSVSLGDVDGDGDLDIFAANIGAELVWTNDGNGNFTDSGQRLHIGTDPFSYSVELGDLDGDGDLDAFVAELFDPNHVWLNDGSGNFSDSGLRLGDDNSRSVSLGDLDADGDLDAFVANSGTPDRIWINQGGAQGGAPGNFSDSGQEIGGDGFSYGASLGDVDGDGDLDVAIANDVPDTVWINDGDGNFSDSGERWGGSRSMGVQLGDIDADGDLDAFVVGGFAAYSRILQNNGSGNFTDTGQILGDTSYGYMGDWITYGKVVRLGDLDGDGDLDAFVGNEGNFGYFDPNRVYLNREEDLAITKSSPQVAVTEGESVTYTITVTNHGPDDAAEVQVADAFPDMLSGVTWTAEISGTGTANLNGSGDIDETIELTAGSSITYTVTAAVVTPLSPDQAVDRIVTNVATVSGGFDPDDSNNTAHDSDVVVLAAAVSSGGVFSEGGLLSDGHSTFITLGDIDGDGDLDAFVGTNSADQVWLNQGGAQSGTLGTFADSGQRLGDHITHHVSLGDVDGDGDLDAIIGNMNEPNRIWINQGGAQSGTAGEFSASENTIGEYGFRSALLGDVDGDGDLDAFLIGFSTFNFIWLNQGGAQGGNEGEFSDSGQFLLNNSAEDAALGDVDGDGDIDAFTSHRDGPSRVWLNQGGAQGGASGVFTDSGQTIGFSDHPTVALGDLDGDGDLDAFVADFENPNRVIINQGGVQGGIAGEFSQSSQLLGNYASTEVSLGDLDGDGDLDAFVINRRQANRVWLNQGGVQGGTPGQFSDSGQLLGDHFSSAVSLGDVDGDGDLDAIIGNGGDEADRVWLNMNPVDVSITKSSNSVAVTYGAVINYTIVVTADSVTDIDGVIVRDSFPALLTNLSWTTSTTGGATAPSGGNGDIDVLVDLPAGSTVTFNVEAQVASTGMANLAAQSIVTNPADAIVPDDFDETDLQNNRAHDSDIIVLTATTTSTGTFSESGQALGNHGSVSVSMGDVDGDGDLDALVANVYGQAMRVWLNQGGIQGGTPGIFSDSGQTLGTHVTQSVTLGDLDGDGDLDAFAANQNQPNRVWLNQGGLQSGTAGVFSDSGQALGDHGSLGVTLGDLDGDGDLDAFVANTFIGVGSANRVWLNQGGIQGGTAGTFIDSGQLLGNEYSASVALGDLDGDGDLDAFVANGLSFSGPPNEVWLNQGGAQGGVPGMFSDSGQALGDHSSRSVALGDLDGDGDLDSFVANSGQADRVWINRGGAQSGTPGEFSDSGQLLGDSFGNSAEIGDLDGDGDLDVLVANFGQPSHVWVNQGGEQGGSPGTFSESGQTLASLQTRDAALGDLDGDGDLDAFIANANQANRVWFNSDEQGSTTIEARHVFYNDSFFDDPTFGNDDDTAIDPTKTALLPGQLATKANYISYTRGINGIMVDIAQPQGTIDAADFEFHDMGRNGDTPTAAPAPDSITVRPGEGVNGSDRVVMTWDTTSGAVFDTTWLRVTVLESVGLDAADVFYFGSAPGEGSGGEFAHVDPADELGARNNIHGFGDPATVDDPWDYNKDRFVDPVDQLFARNNGTGFTTRLNLFTAPAAAPLSAGRSASDEDSSLPTAAALTGGESGWSSVDTGAVSDSANGGGSNAAADERLWSDADESKNEQTLATNWERGVDTVLENDSLLDDLWSDL